MGACTPALKESFLPSVEEGASPIAKMWGWVGSWSVGRTVIWDFESRVLGPSADAGAELKVAIPVASKIRSVSILRDVEVVRVV